MFFDQAKIHVASGDGGHGCVSFRREKHVPRGGPDGGDGGDGGDVIIVPDPQLRDLQDFTYRIHHKARSGAPGQGSRKQGARGEDVIIKVPLGTQVWLEDELLLDMIHPSQRLLVASGGSGGRGNARFTTSVRQAPKFAELGEPGEGMWLRLTLKLMADAGLAGLPNAGKSSLLRRLSNAKPKVADYPFTTVEPMLGMVDWSGDGDVFALADVPGLLEGASEGVGLGHEFLAHLERCRLLLHVVDPTGYYGSDPLDGFRIILNELDVHGEGLGSRPQVILLNKVDVMNPESIGALTEVFVDEVRRLKEAAHPAFMLEIDGEEVEAEQLIWPVSAVTGAGLTAFKRWVGPLLARLAEEAKAVEGDPEAPPGEGVVIDAKGRHGLYRPQEAGRMFAVEKTKSGFTVKGAAVKKLVTRFDLTNHEAIRYLGERLERLGVYAALREAGVQPGDDVDIEGYEFEFQ